jgi:thioredoxin 1
MTVIEINDPDTFKSVVSSTNRLIVIDFGASWCGPCKKIAPQYHQLAEEMQNVVFCKVDIDDFEELAQKFQVKSVPTFVFIKDAQLLETVQGANYNLLVQKCKTLC